MVFFCRSTRSAAFRTSNEDSKRYLYQVTDARIPSWGWSILAPDEQQARLRMVRRQYQPLWTSRVHVGPVRRDRPEMANRATTLTNGPLESEFE